MKQLYHGSIFDFIDIDTSLGKGYKDFGKGFYATANRQHAESIAKRNKAIIERKNKRLSGHGVNINSHIVAYRYNLIFSENTTGLNIIIFKEPDLEWVKFILANRKSAYSTHDYDIVIGPTADEATNTVINNYEETLQKYGYREDILNRLIKELKPENLPKQYFFANQKAVQTIKFDRVKRVII